MPTTLKEQLIAGVHQTEKLLPHVADPVKRAELSTELDAYLERVRAVDSDKDITNAWRELNPLHTKISRFVTRAPQG